MNRLGLPVAVPVVLGLGLGIAMLGASQAPTVRPPPITFTDVTAAAGDPIHPPQRRHRQQVVSRALRRWRRRARRRQRRLARSAFSWTRKTGRPAGRRSQHGLFRNNRDGTFRDVVAGSGLDAVSLYGLGATVADYDNDGRDDVFITTVDGGRLFHNQGGSRFADVTARAGLRDTGLRGQRRVAGLQPRRAARSLRRQLRPVVRRHRHRLLAERRQGLLRTGCLQGGRAEAVSEPRTGPLRRRHGTGGARSPDRQGDGRRGPRLQPRRVAGYLRRQRSGAGQAVSQRHPGRASSTRRSPPASP